MSELRAKVPRAKLSACLTCLLCDNLFTNATTISECLHTFCRECIHKKITEEKLMHCPQCKAYLGCSPLDKLRADHNLQDLRNKLLPGEEKTVEAPRNEAPKTSVTRVKKKSRSSLNANTKGAKPEKKASSNPKESDISPPRSVNAADIDKDDKPRNIGILDDVNTHISSKKAKDAAWKKLVTDDEVIVVNETFKIKFEQEENNDYVEVMNGKVKVAARKKKSGKKSTMQGSAFISVPVNRSNNDSFPVPTIAKKQFHQNKANRDRNEFNPSTSGLHKFKMLRINEDGATKFSADLNIPAQSTMDLNVGTKKGITPIWLSLVASEEKEEGAQLPQIPPSYLRIRVGTSPVSCLMKYIAKKLDLASESEVEISLRGKPISPSMLLQDVVEMWLETKPEDEEIHIYPGSSAKDFVMVLSYGLSS